VMQERVYQTRVHDIDELHATAFYHRVV